MSWNLCRMERDRRYFNSKSISFRGSCRRNFKMVFISCRLIITDSLMPCQWPRRGAQRRGFERGGFTAAGPETQTPLEKLHAQGWPTTQPVNTVGPSQRMDPLSEAVPLKALCKGRGLKRGRGRVRAGTRTSELAEMGFGTASEIRSTRRGVGAAMTPSPGVAAGEDGAVLVRAASLAESAKNAAISRHCRKGWSFIIIRAPHHKHGSME